MRTLFITGFLVVLISACSSTSGRGNDKYTQTWSKSYASTTCTDWNDQMSDAQKFAGAADMLTGARNNGDGGSGLPADSLIEEFQGGVTTACVIPTANVAEIGAGVYLTERETFRP